MYLQVSTEHKDSMKEVPMIYIKRRSQDRRRGHLGSIKRHHVCPGLEDNADYKAASISLQEDKILMISVS